MRAKSCRRLVGTIRETGCHARRIPRARAQHAYTRMTHTLGLGLDSRRDALRMHEHARTQTDASPASHHSHARIHALRAPTRTQTPAPLARPPALTRTRARTHVHTHADMHNPARADMRPGLAGWLQHQCRVRCAEAAVLVLRLLNHPAKWTERPRRGRQRPQSSGTSQNAKARFAMARRGGSCGCGAANQCGGAILHRRHANTRAKQDAQKPEA